MSKLKNVSVPGLRSGGHSVVSPSVRLPALLASSLLLFSAGTPAAAQDPDTRTELETVTIKASPFERSADELAQPVDVLYGEDLDRKRGNTLGETLDGQLGVSSADFGPGVGRPVIRGQGGPRVLMLENGIASMDASSISADHAVSIDPSHAEQIEIIKGPATLIYGSAASAGVINVVNGRLPREVLPGVHGSVDLNWRDNAQQRAGALDLTAGFGEYVLRFDLSGRMADDLEIPGYAEAGHSEEEHEAGGHEEEEEQEGVLENSRVETSSGSVTAAWLRPDRILAITASRLRNSYGVPGHGHEEEHGAGEAHAEEEAEEEHGGVRILLQQQRLDANGEWFDPWNGIERLRTRFGVNDYEHTELEGSEVGTVFDNRELEARIELTHAPLADWRGVFGLQLNHRDFEAIGDEAFVPPVESRSAGLFLVEERALGAHRLELGGRVEHVRHQAEANPDTDFTPLSLSAGFVYQLNEQHHLRVTASRSQRAPASEELYSYGPHLATNSFERGLNSLDVETANNLELGLDRHQGAWRWRVNLFLNQVQDYIYQSEVDQGRHADGSGNGIADGSADRVDEEGQLVAEGELLLVDYRQDDARLYGLEAETRYLFSHGPRPRQLRLYGDTVRGQIDGGPNLPRITPTRLGAGFSGGYGRWYGGVDVSRILDQDRISPLETETPGYTLVSADIEYNLPGRWPTSLYLRGRNLLDEDARRHTSFLKDVAPLPGASVLLGLRAEFDL